MRSVEEHLTKILELVEPLPPYEQPLLEALGLPICEDISSSIDLPSFDNSAMDGYACRRRRPARRAADDTRSRCRSSGSRPPVRPRPTRFARSGGQDHDRAPMPAGADAVVPIEWTDGGRASVEITQAPQPGAARPPTRRRHPGRRLAARRGHVARSAPGHDPGGDRARRGSRRARARGSS